jgi:hypothetical protein
MANLTGQEIRNTYQGLLKTDDNDALSPSEKAITDGLGNVSAISLSTDNLQITGGLKDFTGEIGTPGQFLSSTGTGTNWADVVIPAGVFEAGSGTGSIQAVEGDATASGNYSFAFGVFTTASGYYATASGYYATASGRYSTASGRYATASSNYATASGQYATASGFHSTAFGYQTTASGYYSFVHGSFNAASGNYSVAFGKDTTASHAYAICLGADSNRDGAVFVNELSIMSIPTSAAGLPTGAVWSNAGVLNIVP